MMTITTVEIKRYNELNDVLINPENPRFFTGLNNSEYDELESICKKIVEIDEMVDNHDSKENLYKITYTFRGLALNDHYAFIHADSKNSAIQKLSEIEIPFYAISYINTIHNVKGGE